MEDTVNGHSRVISHSVVALVLLTCTAKLFAARHASAIPGTAQITVLYDAFGKTPGVQKDWGYSALIEFAGKQILFDTGNNPEILEQNAKAKGSDLSKLDFVVMSHRHGHHMGGLPYLLKVNPAVKIYAPKESFGVYGVDLPSTFYRKDPSLPREQRYYDGTRPRLCDSGPPGPLRTFSLSTRTPRSLPTSISSHWFRTNRELSNCANCRWLSIRQRAQFPVL
jgi:7,8-dihydropterin-6-yl-methyl-4-(beta-D-ribofuranosyl)aminobenzene 5'-phosphate synthase